MPAGPDIPQAPTPPPLPGAPAPDEAAARHDRQLAILSELAEAGLEIALALKTRIVETAALEADPAAAGACSDLARAFDRVSRAVRMAIALSERLSKDGAFSVQAARAAAHEARTLRAERVRRIVQRVTKVRFSDGRLRETLDRQARERLFDPDISGELAGRPIGALVAQICADLGLSPPWLALAEEAWAEAEITGRPAGSPYAAWPDLPPEEADEDPDDDFEDDDEGGGSGPPENDPGGSGPKQRAATERPFERRTDE